MTDKERELALYCLKASSDYHSEVCEECINYPNCDHTIQDDVTETIIKALEQENILEKIRAEIEQAADKQFQIAMGIADLNERYTHIQMENAYRHSLNIIDNYRGEV